jgi:hypothetical protein
MSELIRRLMAKDPAMRPDAVVVKADLQTASLEVRSAATQIAPLRQSGSGPALIPAPSPSRDTEPQLAKAGSSGSIGPSSTAKELKPMWSGRIPSIALGVALVLLLGLGLRMLGMREERQRYGAPDDPRPIAPPPTEETLAPQQLENTEPVEEEAAQKPVAPVPVAVAQPASAKAETPEPNRPPATKKVKPPKDPRAELKGRLEKLQRIAKAKKHDAYESAARTYLTKLETASAADLPAIERQAASLEDKLAALK